MNNLPCFLLSLAILTLFVSQVVAATGHMAPAVYLLCVGILCVLGFFKLGGFQEEGQ